MRLSRLELQKTCQHQKQAIAYPATEERYKNIIEIVEHLHCQVCGLFFGRVIERRVLRNDIS